LTLAHLALWSVLAVALIASVATDVLWRRILDVVTLPVIAASLGVRFFAEGLGGPETGLLSGLIGALCALAIFGFLALRGKMGWGDAKLMTAVGAAFGYPLCLSALIFVSLVGALQAVVTLIWQGAVAETVQGFGRRLAERFGRAPLPAQLAARRIPYGVAIALGSFWAMWWQHSNVR
jgi:prepilin peptidase CpaA